MSTDTKTLVETLGVMARNAPHGDVYALTTAAQCLRELQAVVDRLPKTADGVPMTPAMHVWFFSRNSFSKAIEELKVTGWEYLPRMEPGYMFVVNVINEGGETDGVNLACCYSTRAAAEAARKL